MGSTLEHGIYLPSEGEKNCYQGLAGNWNKVDGALGDVAGLKQLIESKFTKEIVTELPTEDINPYCIYMILKTDPETNNIYDEWVYINNAWEYLGNTQVDMTQYYTKQEVNELPAVASGVTSTKVGNYDAHIANGDIHVTASDKAKWDTVALIKQLRLVNTQVGSATTIAFSDFDDTNGIKVGDKCADLDVKVFEITAVDTANQTVTVSPLLDIALDANVMHLSGNETVAGIKTFSEYITSDGSSIGDEYSNNARTNLWLMGTRDTEELSGVLFDTFRQNIAQGTGSHILGIGIKENEVRYEGCRFSWLWDNNLNGYSFSIRPTLQGANQAVEHNLGTSTNKWDTINGINPGALSLPDTSNALDISGYITDLTGSVNTYTALADGYVSIRITGTAMRIAVTNGVESSSQRSSAGAVACYVPVVAGETVSVYAVGTSINNATFRSCKGNV